MMKNAELSLTLEEVAQEVERSLQEMGLRSSQSDHRISDIPDARTIRYYTTLGLIDRPAISGRQARYGSRHVLQLLVIKALQSLSLPLAEIQNRLYGRSDEELESLLSALKREAEGRPEAPPILRLSEVILQPGLKLVAEESWSGKGDEEALVRQFKAALAALRK